MPQNLISIEINHQLAGIEEREKVAFEKKELEILIDNFKKEVDSFFILSTCNRFSVYTLSTHFDFFSSFFSKRGISSSLWSCTFTTRDTVKKIFETACGLHSQFFGERQILNQLKEHYQVAVKYQTLNQSLDLLFRASIHAGKKIQKETSLSELNHSLVDAAHHLVKKQFRSLSDIRIGIFGTGSMAGLVVRKFTSYAVRNLHVMSRDRDRLRLFHDKYGVNTMAYEDGFNPLDDFDLLIGATDKRVDLELQKNRSHLHLIDLGVPRNFDPTLKLCSSISLFDLDQVKSYLKIDKSAKVGLDLIGLRLEEETNRFLEELNRKGIASYTSAYWRKLESLKEKELQWLLPKVKDLSEKEISLIKKYSHKLLRSISRDTLRFFNQMASEGPDREVLETVGSALNIVNGKP